MKKGNTLWMVVSIIMILGITLVSACTESNTTLATSPRVISTNPANGAQNVAFNSTITAAFNVAMNPSTITEATFTLKQGVTPVSGKVIYAGTTATFTPANGLEQCAVYTATITTGAKDPAGNALARDYVWTFYTSCASGYKLSAGGVGGAGGQVTGAGGVGGAVVPGGGGNRANPLPSVISTNPANGARNVALNSAITVTFSGPIDPSTINKATFTLKRGATPISGMVTYANWTATFTPAGMLAPLTTYTATINTGVTTIVWSFTTKAGPAPWLGTAGDFAILAKSGISNTGVTTSITGDIGVSPIDDTAITGFGLIRDASNQFSITSPSTLVTGRVYAANMATPTPIKMTTAISDMQTAYTDAAGRATAPIVNLSGGNLGGLTLAPGLYKFSTGVTIPTDVTLAGGANDVWIFQISGTLDISSAKKVLLSGGALPQNIFWQVTSTTTLGTNSVFNGNILDQTNIRLLTGAALNGRALAQTAVTMDSNTVVKP